MAFFTLQLNEAEIEKILHDPAGPVGDILAEVATKMTATAVALAPLQKPKNYSWSLAKSTSYQPHSSGFTKAGTRFHPPDIDSAGRLFAGTDAPYKPVMWLERGRSHPRMTLHPFMSEALYSASL